MVIYLKKFLNSLILTNNNKKYNQTINLKKNKKEQKIEMRYKFLIIHLK